MPQHVSRPPFVNRRGAFIGDPVMSIYAQGCRAAIQAMKDFRYQHLGMAYTGVPDATICLNVANTHIGRWHFVFQEPARPDATTEPLRQYGVQLLPWELATYFDPAGGYYTKEVRYLDWYADFAGAPGVSTRFQEDQYTWSNSSVLGDTVPLSDMRTWSIGCEATPIGAGNWRHIMIESSNWLPAHFGVYQIPRENVTNAQAVVAPGSIASGVVIRGYGAGNTDHSWGSVVDLVGRNNADGPEWNGRRCLFSFIHGRGLWLNEPSLSTIETWRTEIRPRDLLLPGQATTTVRPVWIISCDLAGAVLKWTCPSTGISSTYTTVGGEAETMVTGPSLTISHPVAGGDLVVHYYQGITDVTDAECTIHGAYLWEETQ